MSTKTLVVFELPDRQLLCCRPSDLILAPQRGSVYMLGGGFYRAKDSVQSIGDDDGSHLVEMLNSLYPDLGESAVLFNAMRNIGAGDDNPTAADQIVLPSNTIAEPERLLYLQMERISLSSALQTQASLPEPTTAAADSSEIATKVVLEVPGTGLIKCDLDDLGLSPQQGSVYCYGGSTFEVAHVIEPVAHRSNDLFTTLSALFGPNAVGGLLAAMKVIGAGHDSVATSIWSPSQEPERLLYLRLKNRRRTSTVSSVFASA